MEKKKAMDIRSGMIVAMVICVALGCLVLSVQAATTEVTVTKYAANNYSIEQDETTVNYTWMMENLDIYGGGETHYFFQGPIFQGEWEDVHPNDTWNDTAICNGDTIPGTSVALTNAPACIEAERWNPAEDTNCGAGAVPKDLGAVNGTDVNDLCDLVGGLAAGDSVKVQASDNFAKEFPAEVFYDPDPAVGRGILCWYTADCEEGFTGTGYVPDFTIGMRLAFLADNSTNPWEEHIFGLKDMVENFPSVTWHYYYSGEDGFYPSCGGFQVKWVNRVKIYPPHLHDFNETGDTTGWAFGNETGASPGADDPNTEFDSTAYDNIADDDGTFQSDVTTTDGNYAAHRFNFSIETSNAKDGPIAKIQKLNVTWNGKGSHDSLTDGANLYIYNYSTPGYELLQASGDTEDPVYLTGAITSGISNYVSASNNVTVLVKQTSAHDDEEEDPCSHIETDYVSLEVIHHYHS